MTISRFDVTDSRGIMWHVTFTGPVGVGTMPPAQSLDDLPQHWLARFTRSGQEGDITIPFETGDVTEGELVEALEREPEWQHERWAGAE